MILTPKPGDRIEYRLRNDHRVQMGTVTSEPKYGKVEDQLPWCLVEENGKCGIVFLHEILSVIPHTEAGS